MPRQKTVSVYPRSFKTGTFWYCAWLDQEKRVAFPTHLEVTRTKKNRDEALREGYRLFDQWQEAKNAPTEPREVPTLRVYALCLAIRS